MPEVSVIIPYYNDEQFIDEAILSVINQTYQDWEIVVVDDGSNNDARRLIQKYPGRILYFHQENRGAGAARNLGVSKAHGKWLAFLDADDVWYPHKLDVQLKHASRHPEADFIYADMDTIDEKSQIIGERFLTVKRRRKKRKPLSLRSLVFQGRPFPYPSTVLVKKKCFLKAGGFNALFRGNYHEDFECFARIAQTSSLQFISESLVKYRVSAPNKRLNISTREVNWKLLLDSLREMWSEEPIKLQVLSRYYAKHFIQKGTRYLALNRHLAARRSFKIAFFYHKSHLRCLHWWLVCLIPSVGTWYARSKQLGSKKSD